MLGQKNTSDKSHKDFLKGLFGKSPKEASVETAKKIKDFAGKYGIDEDD